MKCEIPLTGRPLPKVTLSKDNNTISLAWEKPNYDGGSPITGYMIEKREGANSKWSKANLTNITDTRFTVTGLTQDETYEFRVMAKNAVGSISNPSITAGPATCVDTYGKNVKHHRQTGKWSAPVWSEQPLRSPTWSRVVSTNSGSEQRTSMESVNLSTHQILLPNISTRLLVPQGSQ
uniref:Fibronectin type-III domain-containing protein n=1 Tax=Oryzias melastigma TaxID=30732 RepID=A0A3B3C1F3_ORYME